MVEIKKNVWNEMDERFPKKACWRGTKLDDDFLTENT